MSDLFLAMIDRPYIAAKEPLKENSEAAALLWQNWRMSIGFWNVPEPRVPTPGGGGGET